MSHKLDGQTGQAPLKSRHCACCEDSRARLGECRSRNQQLTQKLLALGVQPGALAFTPEGTP
jgi:hypothetical protein